MNKVLSNIKTELFVLEQRYKKELKRKDCNKRVLELIEKEVYFLRYVLDNIEKGDKEN